MRILAIGPGAIGGTTAAFMTLAGYDVTVLCRSEELARSFRERGLQISGVRGEYDVPLQAIHSLEGLENSFDYCIVSTKAYDTIPAVQSALPCLKKEGLVLVLQNGICVEKLLSAAGAERSACGVTTFSATMHSPSHMELTGEGEFQIGMADGRDDPRLESLRMAMSSMVPTKICTPILPYLFSKLVINSGITCGGALTGQLLGQMLSQKDVRRFFIAMVYEDMALAEKMGIRVPAFGGKLDYYRFISGSSRLDSLRRHIMIYAVGLRYRNLKSSSLTSLQRGKPTEVSALNAWICEKARLYNVPTPVNDKLVALIREIERGERSSSPDNIKELTALL